MIRAGQLTLLLAGSAILAGCASYDGTADLAILKAPLLAPASPQIGEPVLITAEIWNLGDGSTSTTTAWFQIDGQTRVAVPVRDLEPGEMARLVTSLTIAVSGYHTLTVIVDPDNAQDDADRGNNTFISGIPVSGYGDG